MTQNLSTATHALAQLRRRLAFNDRACQNAVREASDARIQVVSLRESENAAYVSGKRWKEVERGGKRWKEVEEKNSVCYFLVFLKFLFFLGTFDFFLCVCFYRNLFFSNFLAMIDLGCLLCWRLLICCCCCCCSMPLFHHYRLRWANCGSEA